jgi:phasin family protein
MWATKQLHVESNKYQEGKMADKTVMDMFADMAKQINLPKIDYEAFVDIHRKNLEAMQKSAAVLAEGGRAVVAKQQEILAEVGREAQQMLADFKPGGSAQEVATKQAELAKRVFEATVKNTKDIAELVQKSSSEAPKIILDRMRASFTEARAAVESRKA